MESGGTNKKVKNISHQRGVHRLSGSLKIFNRHSIPFVKRSDNMAKCLIVNFAVNTEYLGFGIAFAILEILAANSVLVVGFAVYAVFTTGAFWGSGGD